VHGKGWEIIPASLMAHPPRRLAVAASKRQGLAMDDQLMSILNPRHEHAELVQPAIVVLYSWRGSTPSRVRCTPGQREFDLRIQEG
jgi:hypothetical protein